MAPKNTPPHLLFIFSLSLLICFQPNKALNDEHGSGNKVKGMFVFGSSLVDNGNNNFIQNTIAKANYPPYGIDFPLGSSGRFTNGHNVIDLLGNRLKLPEYLPVFNDPSTTGMRIVHGVNYASGGSGILDDTGSIAGNVRSLNEQIKDFEEVTLVELGNKREQVVGESIFVVGSGGNDYTLNYFLFPNNITVEAFTSNLTSTLSSQLKGNVRSLNEQIKDFEEVTLVELGNKREQVVGESIFVVGSGGNDYTLNYFLFPNNITVEAFTSNLTATLSSQLKRLYSLGARRFLLMALYPLGCSPNVRARQPFPYDCSPTLNRAARLFNAQLRTLVRFVKPQMPGSTLIYVNAYKIIMDIINNPISKGFMDISHPCCEVRTIIQGGNGISCTRGGSTCANRDIYVYFDGLHPTEAVNRVLVTKAYTSNLITEVYPFNIQRLENYI